MDTRAAIAVALAAVLVPALAGAQQPPPADTPSGPPPPVDSPRPQARDEPKSPPPPPAEPRSERPPAASVAATNVPGYCQYVQGVADAEAAQLVAPEIFGSFGVINVGQAEGGDGVPLDEPKPRIMVGLEYDVIELWRGVEVKDRAEVLCRRYRAQSALDSAVRAGADVGSAPALAARAKIIAEALPTAEALLEGLRGDVREARATIDEVDVARLRLDELRAEVRNVVLAQERVESLPHRDGGSLADVITAYRNADDEVEEIEGGLRNLNSWSVELRGGYDEILDVEQDTPLFGLITVTFDIGGFWVPGANDRAREGRRRWVAEDVMGSDRRVAELVGQLRSVKDVENARLREVSLLVDDLARQLQEVRGLGTSRVRRYESFLFFELTRLRGEQAYLQTHLAELDRILGTVGM